ncbi:MAG: hypothetical protein IKP55_01755 [Clostridia bacterium]|nr:hypothetical protein [Clostridia bacterium]
MLYIPNLLWTKRQPENYGRYAKNENRVLLAFERVGEVSVTVAAVIFSDFNPRFPLTPWSLWLLASLVLMLLYEVFWIRYFRSRRTMLDFYRGLLGIPVPGASLPVLAFLLLAVYGGNLVLLVFVVLLGVGHIGIHSAHRKEALADQNAK